jgi:hypothetical protein
LLRTIAITLSRSRTLRRGLAWLTRLQLQIAVRVLLRCVGVEAVLLRRREVLLDAYPGDSDYDLTCLLDPASEETILAVAARYRFLKRIFPILGEALFVDARDFGEHFAFAFPDYGLQPLPHVLGGDVPPFPAAPVGQRMESVFRRAVQVWKFRVAGALVAIPSDRRVFARPIRKNVEKLHWLADILEDRPTRPLRYDEKLADEGRREFPAALARSGEIAWSRIRSVPSPAEPLEPRWSWRVAGSTDVVRDDERAVLNDIFDPVKRKHPEAVDAVTVSPLRLYRFNRSLYVHLRKGGACEADLAEVLHGCARRMRTLPFRFTPNVPIAVDRRDWDLVRRNDTVADALFRLGYYDVFTGRHHRQGKEEIELPKPIVRRELLETVVLLSSIPRSEDTNYVFDLFFGQLLPFVRALETGVFHASLPSLAEAHVFPRALNREQRELFQLYVDASQDELDRLPTRRVWSVFASWILEECDKARTLWQSSQSTHGNRHRAHRSAPTVSRLGPLQP